jgi:hypothetical protein
MKKTHSQQNFWEIDNEPETAIYELPNWDMPGFVPSRPRKGGWVFFYSKT